MRFTRVLPLACTVLACGPRRPEIPPTPRPLIGSCYALAYTPAPAPLGAWEPRSTIHFLGTPYTPLRDSAGQTNGHLARDIGDSGVFHEADWWVQAGRLHLAYRVPRIDRHLVFDSLMPPAVGRWDQVARGRRSRGTVTATPAPCR